MSDNIDLSKLSPEEREAVLKILSQLASSGTSSTLDELKYSDYTEIPVDIDTFLDDEDYLGKSLWTTDEYTGERRCSLFPYWRETLKKIFPTNTDTAYNTVIFTGAIGLGKTTIAVIAQLYLLYRMLCLRDPSAHYQIQHGSGITFSMLNITLDAAHGVAWQKAQDFVQNSSWFMAHGYVNASKVEPVWQPDGNIELLFGSSDRNVIGRNLFCLDGDTEIFTDEGAKAIKDLVGKTIRVATRADDGTIQMSDPCTVAPTVKSDEECEVEMEDGSVIHCTPNHRFMLTSGEYREAEYLSPDDILVAFDSESILNEGVRVKSVRRVHLDEPKQFYDVIDAAPFHNFFFRQNSKEIFFQGHNCNLTDEVNFGIGSDVEKKKKRMMSMIAKIDARMQSRFMRGTKLPTLNLILSSKDTEQSFLDSYINLKKKNESKTTLIIDEPQWVVRNDKGTPDDPGSFYVAVGNRFLAHELLPVDATESLIDSYRAKGYSMLKVPPGYREAFETNLDNALADIAGISIASTTRFISGVRLNQAKADYQNPFVKDVIEVGNAPNDTAQYSDFFDMSRVDRNDLSRPLFVHLDMSTSGDKTGIAGTWITGKRPTAEGQESSAQMFYKLAFSVSVKAPKGYQISYTKNINFVRWLRDRGFNVKCVSADTFQSTAVLQQLQQAGFNIKTISVDRVDQKTKLDTAYVYLKSAIYEQRVQIYRKCDLLTDELVGLERMSTGKVDHTPDGVNSKDQADAFCGSLFSASQYADQYAYEYGETLNASIDITMDDTSNPYRDKRQLISAMQDEMLKIFDEQKRADEKEDEERRRRYRELQAISDGIIAL